MKNGFHFRIGGGKGLICEPADRQHIQPEFRQKLFYDYGDFVTSLNGCFSMLSYVFNYNYKKIFFIVYFYSKEIY